MSASGGALDKLQRYASAARRDYYRAHRELEKTQSTKKKQDTADAMATLEAYLNAPVPFDWSASKRPVQNEPNLHPGNARPQPSGNLALRL